MTIRRARESHSMVSGVELATLLDFAEPTSASVIALSLLPFAPGETEITEQGREHEERNHGDCDSRALAELAAGDAALECQCREQMGRVDRTAARDGIDELEISESEDDRKSHHDCQDRQHHRQGDVAKALPGGGAIQH